MIDGKQWTRGVLVAAVISWLLTPPVMAVGYGDGWLGTATVASLLFGLPSCIALGVLGQPVPSALSRGGNGTRAAIARTGAMAGLGALTGIAVLVAGSATASLGSAPLWLPATLCGALIGATSAALSWLLMTRLGRVRQTPAEG